MSFFELQTTQITEAQREETGMRIADPHSTRTDHLPLSVLQTHTASKISLPI